MHYECSDGDEGDYGIAFRLGDLGLKSWYGHNSDHEEEEEEEEEEGAVEEEDEEANT